MEETSSIKGWSQSPDKTDILEMFMEANEGRDLRDRGNVKAVTRTAAN